MPTKRHSTAKPFDLVWTIGGEAGNGIMVIGAIMAKACSRSGLSVFDYQEFPSLIRGGHNVYQVHASSVPIHSQSRHIDVLVALNRESIDKHVADVISGGIILYDGNEVQLDQLHIKPSLNYVNVPLLQIARDVANERLMMNTVALGASARAIGMDFSLVRAVIVDQFKHKGPKIVELDIKTAKAGYDYVDKHFHAIVKKDMPVVKNQKQLVVSGVEASALGAIQAGMKFYSAYPMTPATGYLSYFASIAEEMNLVVKQTEDEIAAINMAIGASYAGVRSMAATSGGGFSLMVEGLGLAGMSETPLVIVEGMRGGPSTGLPTWTEQGDLLFVRHASQGEFPRVVMAPGDMEECFYLTAEAFNIAEQFQIPVIILIDKYLADSHASVPQFDLKKVKIVRSEMYHDTKEQLDEAAPRYQVTPSGVSPRMIPGVTGVVFNVASDEHDECGAIEESEENRNRQMNKRMKKLHEASAILPDPIVYGAAKQGKADLTIIAWGSSKGPILDALKILEAQGVSVNFVQLTYLHPLPTAFLKKVFHDAKRTMMIEGNFSGQAEAIIRQECLHAFDYRFRKFDGRPFYAEEIAEQVRQALSHGYKE